MAISLDPKDVLAHLQQMGYYNVSEEQLQEFILDLRKLIKYDQTKCKCIRSGVPTVPNNSYAESSSSTSSCTVNTSAKSTGRTFGHGIENISETSSTSAKNISVSRKLGAPKNTKVPADKDENSVRARSSVTVMSSQTTLSVQSSTMSSKYSAHSTRKTKASQDRPNSAFIRSWRIQNGTTAGAPPRCDPVALYHHYQNIWKNQKVPGENRHSDLRWRIREKMLGDDPHPRPISQASSMEVFRKRGRV